LRQSLDERDTRWQGAGEAPLLWEDWGSAYSVFSPATGETHILTELPAEVLRQLSQSRSRITELSETLAKLCETGNSAEWQRKIAAIVENLESLELVQRVP
jgi:PqqD family protein of HPr-rel-A system